MSGYRTIVADPPWEMQGAAWATAATDKGRPQKHYKTMSLEEIASLPVRNVAQDKAHLYLWCLSSRVEWGFEVARRWGFPEVVILLTWAKPGMGVGRFQCNTEHVLLARRGGRHGGNGFGRTGGTWFNWQRGRHSEKPEAFYDLVEQASSGPYLELFARKERLGWGQWGNESLNTAVIDMETA